MKHNEPYIYLRVTLTPSSLNKCSPSQLIMCGSQTQFLLWTLLAGFFNMDTPYKILNFNNFEKLCLVEVIIWSFILFIFIKTRQTIIHIFPLEFLLRYYIRDIFYLSIIYVITQFWVGAHQYCRTLGLMIFSQEKNFYTKNAGFLITTLSSILIKKFFITCQKQRWWWAKNTNKKAEKRWGEKNHK